MAKKAKKINGSSGFTIAWNNGNMCSWAEETEGQAIARLKQLWASNEQGVHDAMKRLGGKIIPILIVPITKPRKARKSK